MTPVEVFQTAFWLALSIVVVAVAVAIGVAVIGSVAKTLRK